MRDIMEKLMDPKWVGKCSLVAVDGLSEFGSASGKAVGVGDNLAADRVLTVALESSLNHVVQYSNVGSAQEINTSAAILNDCREFLKYPISSILDPCGSAEKEKEQCKFTYSFNAHAQKPEFIDLLQKYISVKTSNENLIYELLTTGDELFTNAIFNAPYANGEKQAPMVKRGTDFPPSERPATMLFGFNENRMVLGCIDKYGALDPHKLINRILGCYQEGLGESIQKDELSGAGIGCYLMYNSCISFYAIVIPGEATGVFCVYPVGLSNKKRVLMPKNLHFCKG